MIFAERVDPRAPRWVFDTGSGPTPDITVARIHLLLPLQAATRAYRF